jgi:hypothetical protein
VPEIEDLSGRKLGEFVLRARIGEGGFGAVYRCEQPLLGREAVIKVLHPRLRDNGAGGLWIVRDGADPERLAQRSAVVAGAIWLSDGRVVVSDAASWLHVYDVGSRSLITELVVPMVYPMFRSSSDGSRLLAFPASGAPGHSDCWISHAISWSHSWITRAGYSRPGSSTMTAGSSRPAAMELPGSGTLEPGSCRRRTSIGRRTSSMLWSALAARWW